MKHLAAVTALMLTATPALAGLDALGIIIPPAKYLRGVPDVYCGEENATAIVTCLPGDVVRGICDLIVPGGPQPYGCSLKFHTGLCIIWVNKDVSIEEQYKIARHESAHCWGGWPANHPLN